MISQVLKGDQFSINVYSIGAFESFNFFQIGHSMFLFLALALNLNLVSIFQSKSKIKSKSK